MSGIGTFCQASTGVLLMEQDKYESKDNRALKGVYADCFRIGHSAYKFVLDFGQLTSGHERPHFHTRVIIGPDIAKEFLETIENSIRKYEDEFGSLRQNE